MRKFYSLFVAMVCMVALNKVAGQVTQTFSYTGANQTFTVPAGVTSISVKLWGAGGAGSSTGGSGGSGALVKGTLAVTPGQSLAIVVGGGGVYTAAAASTGGFGGGGNSGGPRGGSGGGYSGIFDGSVSFTNALTVAGGGAGGGYESSASYGGAGGATTGSNGGNYSGTYTGGSGATVAAGGAGGLFNGAASGSNGTALAGGAGNVNATYGGGGGGGGYYGGGGGYGSSSATYYSGAGGGGASYLGSLTSTTNTVGTTSAAGAATQAPGSGETGYVAGVGNGGTSGGTAGGNGLVTISYYVACATPTTQPITLGFSAVTNTSLTGTYVSQAGNGNNYLVVRTTTSAAPSNPVSGTTYTAGSTALGGYVEYAGTALTWNSTGLLPGATYYWWVFTYNNTVGTCGPTYYTTSPLSGSQATTTASTTTGPITTSGNNTVVYTSCGSAVVEVWGSGGGGGGGAANPAGGGGGSGGAYAKNTFTLSAGTYNYTVGAAGTAGAASATVAGAGNPTYFGNTTAGSSAGNLILAVGGAGGTGSATANGSGARGAAVTTGNNGGSTNWYGGQGGQGNGTTGTAGSGGGSGGTGSAGNAGATGNGVAGATAVAGGGNGGNSGSGSVGLAPSAPPGGGGGGGQRTGGTSRAGGAGGVGQIKIVFTPFAASATPTITTDPICTGTTSISGTSTEANGSTVTLYDNGVSIGTTTVTASGSSPAWTVSSFTSLASSAGHNITAKVTASGKCVSEVSPYITVSAGNSAGSPSSTPTLCINSALTAITITTVSATGISNNGVAGANGLPAGVSATWASNTITISGTPTASGTFNYIIPLTGGCSAGVNATGTITVNDLPTLTGTSSSSTTICGGNSADITVTGILNVAQTISYTVGGTAGTQTANVTGSGGTATFSTIALGTANSGQTITITGIARTDVTPNCSFTPSGSNTATLPTVLAAIADPSGTISNSGNPACGSSTLTYSAPSATIYWETSATGTDISNPTTSSYILSSPGGTIYARAFNGTCWSGGTVNSGSITVTAIPAAPTSVTGSTPICLGSVTNLNATTSSNSINWYDASTGGTLLGTSASATNFPYTPSAAGSFTYYAEASTGSVSTNTVTFSYTGANQPWTVPAGVTSISVKAWGAGGGGSGVGPSSGGTGALVKGTLAVTPGQSLVIVAGGGGINTATTGGFGGGGASGAINGASGGGYSGIFNTSVSQANALAIAGGGAGGGYYGNATYGGAGGATTGSNGGNQTAAYTGGSGGSTAAGGAGGLYNSVANGNAGTALQGGAGNTNTYGGGGGGGGYYGGGGGYGSNSTTNWSSGGGGGASYLGSMTSTTNTVGATDAAAAGAQAPGSGEIGYIAGVGNGGSSSVPAGGNGLVIITYTVTTTGCSSSSRTATNVVTVNGLPDASNLSATAAANCGGGGSVVTVSSTTLSSGTYTVTYNVSGTNTVSSTTASMTFTAGAPGTGTFTTAALATSGAANVVNITGIALTSTGCNRTVSVSTAAFTSTTVNTWTGGTSTDWNTASNWSCGIVPTSASDVTIASATNQPIIGAAASCNNIVLNSGTSLTINNTLTVSGNWTNNSSASAVSGTGTVLFGGNTIIAGSFATSFPNLTVTGTVTNTVNGTSVANTYSQSAGTFTASNSTTTAFTLNFKDFNLSGGTFDNSSGTVTPIATIITISGSYTQSSPSTFTTSGSGVSQITFSGGGNTTYTNAYTTAVANFKWLYMQVSNNTTLTLNSPFSQFGVYTTPVAGVTVDAGSTIICGTNPIFTASASVTFAINGTLKTAITAGLNGSASTTMYYTTTPATNIVTLGASSTVEYNSTSPQTVTARTDYANLTITGASTKTAAGIIGTTADVVINAGATFAGSTFAHTVKGNWTNYGTYSPSTGTVTFNGTGSTQTFVGNTTFYNLTLSGSAGTDFGTSTITIGNAFSNTAGSMNGNASTFIFTGGAGTISGANAKNFYDLQINGGAVISHGAGGNIFVSHDYTNNGSFTQIAAALNFNMSATGGASQSMSGTGSSTFANFVIPNNSTVNANAHSFAVGGTNFAVTSAGGQFNGGTGTVSMTGLIVFGPSAGTINFNNLTIGALGSLTNSINKNFTVSGNFTNNGTYTKGTETISFINASTPTSNSINGTVVTQTFNSITVNKPGQTLTVGGSTTTLNLSGTMTLTAGTLVAGTAANINMTGNGGNWTNNGGAFTPGTGTVTFNNTAGPQAINGSGTSQDFNNLVVNKTAQTLSAAGSMATLNVSGTVTLTSGTLNAGTVTTINMTGSGGNWTNNGGTFTPASSNIIFSNTSGAQAINGTAATQTFNSITVAKTAQSLSVAGSTTTLNLGGSMTITSGTFVAGTASNINMIGNGGNWTNNGGTFTTGTGTVTFNNAAGSQNINGSSSSTFYNLTLNKASGINLNLSGANGITINNALTLTLGTLVTNANTVTLAAAATISEAGGQTVLGNLTKTRPFSTPDNFGGMGVTITSAAALGSTTVTRVTGTSYTIGSQNSILRYFDITPTVNTGLNATLAFTYDNNIPASELNGNNAATLEYLKSTNGGSTWSNMGGTAAGSTVTLTGLNDFSRWTLASGCFNWSGANSTDWSDAGNWQCGLVPNSSTAVVSIPSGKPNYPVITGAQSFSMKNITISGAASVTNNGTMNVAGTFNNAGTFTSTSGTIVMNGTTGAQTIPANLFDQNTIKSLTISNTSGVSLGGALTLTDVLSFGNVNNTTFTTNDNLTLHSDVNNTARIADLTNAVANVEVNSGNDVTGKVTVERFMKCGTMEGGDRAYRLLAPSVNTSTSIHANWQEGAISKTDNPVPHYGTHITGTTVDQTNGLDATYTAQPSLFLFNGSGWTSVLNTNAPTLNAKTGYLIFIRGDRNYDLNQPQPGPFISYNTTLRAKGTLLTGTQTYPGLTGAADTAGAKMLVTNPYAAPINWVTLYEDVTTGNRTNFTGDAFVLNPHIGGVNGNGGYVTVKDLLGSPVISPSGTGVTEQIQSGEAFFVTVRSGAADPSTFTVKEKYKSTNNNTGAFTPMAVLPRLDAAIYFNDAILGRRLGDEVAALYNNSFSAGVDGNDADQMGNANEDISFFRNAHKLSIETRPLITSMDTLFVYMQRMRTSDYQWEIKGNGAFDPSITAELVDNYTGTRTPIDLSSNTTITFNVNTAIAGSKATNRFYIVFNPTAPLPVTLNNIRAYEHNTGINVDWSVSQQINMDRYEVERSFTGANFNRSATVAASATNEAADYTWFDANPNQGANFYRVKMIDRNGASSYSRVVKVVLGKGAPAITVYPNPIIGNTVTLQLTNLDKGTYTVSLINKLGQEVYNSKISHAGGSATQQLDLQTKLAQGTYQVKVTGEGGTFTMQVIKQEGN